MPDAPQQPADGDRLGADPRNEARLLALEDRAEIADLIARYGPAADALDGATITALWADGGTYTIGDTTLANARPAAATPAVDPRRPPRPADTGLRRPRGAMPADPRQPHGSTHRDQSQPTDTIGALVDFDEHRGLVAAGCGHLLTPPDIRLAGERATAVNHSVVLVRRERGWQVARLSANRWEFRRTADGWRVESRLNRLLDGDHAARELLGHAWPERTGGPQDD